jgi:hypothetical protein
MTDKITKTDWEKIFRYHEFTRVDGNGWLRDGETISTPSVLCIQVSDNSDQSSAMVDNVSVHANGTQIIYRLKAGTVDGKYKVKIRAITSDNQELEDVLDLTVT